MSLLDEALSAPECVISVMGAHAGEDAATIFERKVGDCRTAGRTFWVAKSAKARPHQGPGDLQFGARIRALRRSRQSQRSARHRGIGRCK